MRSGLFWVRLMPAPVWLDRLGRRVAELFPHEDDRLVPRFGALGLRHLEELVECDRVELLERSDLERFDYDPPRERLALVVWSRGSWVVHQGGSARDWSWLHRTGVLLFGASPWRRAQVVGVVGRLGSVEAAVSALPAWSASFSYEFEMSADAAELVEARRHRPSAAPGGRDFDPAARDRARWRKFDRMDLARRLRPRPRQLF